MTAPLKPEEVTALNDILDTAIDKIFDEFEERINGKLDKKGVKLKVSFAEQASVNGARLLMQMARNYTPERKLQRLVDGSNKALPKLTKIFSDETLLDVIPDKIKTAKAVELCEKAGAAPLAKLLKKGITPAA